jgi:hypothetical protein
MLCLAVNHHDKLVKIMLVQGGEILVAPMEVNPFFGGGKADVEHFMLDYGFRTLFCHGTPPSYFLHYTP